MAGTTGGTTGGGGGRTVVAQPPPQEELHRHVAFFAILLPGRPDRAEKVEAMRRLIPSLTVLEAVDGARLEPEELRRMVASGFLVPGADGSLVDAYVTAERRRLSRGNLGAFLSHRQAMARVAALADAQPGGGPRYGVVLEDDVVLRPGFLEAVALLTSVCDGLREQGGVVPDVVNMYVFEQQRQFFPQFAAAAAAEAAGEVPSAALVPTPEGLWGLQAYFMPPAGASKALGALWPMRGAVDEQVTRVGLNSLTLVGATVLDGEVIKSYTNTTAPLDDALAGVAPPTTRIGGLAG